MNQWLLYTVIAGSTALFSLMFWVSIKWFSRQTMFYDRKFGDSRTFHCGDLGNAKLTYMFDEGEELPALKLDIYRPGRRSQTLIWTFDQGKRGEQDAYRILMEATNDSIMEQAESLINQPIETLKPNQKIARL